MEIVKLSKEDGVGVESLLHISKTDNFGSKVAFVADNQLFAVSVLRPHSLSLVSLCCMSLSLSLSVKIHGKWKQLRSPPSVRYILFLNALFSFSLLWILIFSLLMSCLYTIWVGSNYALFFGFIFCLFFNCPLIFKCFLLNQKFNIIVSPKKKKTKYIITKAFFIDKLQKLLFIY